MADAVEPAGKEAAERRPLPAGLRNNTEPCSTRRGQRGWALCQLQVPLYRFKVCLSESRGLIFICGAGHVPPGSGMTTKIIHFMVNGRLEQAEFGADCSAADVKDLFRAAAEAGPHHILKMYKTNGSVVNISPRLEANSEDSYYRLEVVASDLHSVGMPTELDNMEYRLHHLESKVIEDVGKTPDIICELKSQVESFKRKLEVRHSNPTTTRLSETAYSHNVQEEVDKSCRSCSRNSP